MAAISRIQLLIDEKIWLPSSNVLCDSSINNINESIISNQIPADDEIHFAEALCKGLRAIAFANKAKYLVDSKGTKREKVGDVEVERFEGTSKDPWGDFIKSLTDICPIIGFTGLKQGIGMTISPSDKFVITNEANASSLITLEVLCAGVGTVNNDLFL